MTSQTAFAAALCDPDLPAPPGLRVWNGSDPAVRFAVYRNNVVVSLIDALAATFPVVQALVGADFFRAMARLYVQAHPPRSRVMAAYGEDFAAFIESFEPAASVPYLADVARLEKSQVQAYHAADVPAIAPAALQAALADPAQLATLCLGLHPSVQVVDSAYAVFSLWAAHHGGEPVADVDQPQTALVLRCGLEVEILCIAAAAGRFITTLQQGDSLLAAAGADPALDLPATLALLIRQQLITHLTFEAST
nr:DNA-binding domain-containing protein [uncultured Albidiferax sp.]